jgi:carbamoyl-phosphate synthase / aspartate carbamoyltransferase
MLAKMLVPKASNPATVPFDSTPVSISDYIDTDLIDPNTKNLVAEISTSTVREYAPTSTPVLSNGEPIKILALDVGMKNNQIRCFTLRGVTLKIVPWNHDITSEKDYDGLFISNGPGDPTVLTDTVARVKKVMDSKKVPVFGICLGHQLMALACGAQTEKLLFGNRGILILHRPQHSMHQ